MAFIDIFNFKKYFITPSDSQVARIGHVNAAYDASQPKFTVDTVTQSTDVYTSVTINSLSGKVTTYSTIGPSPTGGFVVNNSLVKADSVILLTVNPVFADRNLEILAICSDITDGSFRMNVQTVGAVTTSSPVTVNFLVIN